LEQWLPSGGFVSGVPRLPDIDQMDDLHTDTPVHLPVLAKELGAAGKHPSMSRDQARHDAGKRALRGWSTERGQSRVRSDTEGVFGIIHERRRI
jgi:hypothetical protein